MVRIVVMLVAVMMVAGVARAEDKSSGCGLGWKVTERKSILSSLIRAYTNALASNTSGMTSGTSGCDQHSIVKQERAPEHFVEANYNNLMVDMAKGEGEYVTTLGHVMGCSPDSVGRFNSMTQKNYEQIFSSDQVEPSQLLQNLKNQVSRDPQLAVACQAALI